VAVEKFGKYVLLTNFQNYVDLFAKMHEVPVTGRDRPMPNATAGEITIVNFGMGSATAATVMDLLSAISPKAVLFPGQVRRDQAPGGDRRSDPCRSPRSAAKARANDYFPAEVPALPAFALQKAISTTIRDHARTTGPDRLYDETPGVGARRGLQKILAEDPRHGGRHGDRPRFS